MNLLARLIYQLSERKVNRLAGIETGLNAGEI